MTLISFGYILYKLMIASRALLGSSSDHEFGNLIPVSYTGNANCTFQTFVFSQTPVFVESPRTRFR